MFIKQLSTSKVLTASLFIIIYCPQEFVPTASRASSSGSDERPSEVISSLVLGTWIFRKEPETHQVAVRQQRSSSQQDSCVNRETNSGARTQPCGEPAEERRSLDKTPFTFCDASVKKPINQQIGSMPIPASRSAKLCGCTQLKAREKSIKSSHAKVSAPSRRP